MSNLLRAALARMLEQARLPSHQYGYPQPDQMLATPTGRALAALVAAVVAWSQTDYGDIGELTASGDLMEALAALREAMKP